MLSVGAIHSEDRFCTALAERVGQGEVGGCHPEGESAYQLLLLAEENPWSSPAGHCSDFLHKRAYTKIKSYCLELVGRSSKCKQ